ncbi:cyclase family protein [Pseudodesulfovibrio sp.]|uniref:cyclase family protein n=1 Tax=unclassified Pseudodesulfovibrio TaxID=2661612 RepID=UPI003AFFCE70
MHVIDLTHAIRTGMGVFPGDEPVNVRRDKFVARDGYAVTSLRMGTHTGTHLDLPAHLDADAPGLDWMGPDNFVGWGAVVDCTAVEGRPVDQADLVALSAMDGLEFALIRTGWESRWGTDVYFESYPVLSELACRYLGGLGLKGLGLDTPSPDKNGLSLPCHRTLFAHDMVIVENLCNLAELPPQDFLFSCLPLRIADGEGCPVRAVGMTF